MKTFTAVSLLFAAALPGSLVATALGLPLPTVLDPGTAFGLFVAAFTLLTVFGDYARISAKPLALAPDATSAGQASATTLATEERRLAA